VGATEVPMRRWTGIDFTEPDEEEFNGDGHRNRGGKRVSSPGMKSTRHISPQLQNVHDQLPTAVTFQVSRFWSNSIFCLIKKNCFYFL
jgi:hypothetical protein